MADNFIVWSNTVVNALVCWWKGVGYSLGMVSVVEAGNKGSI